MGKTKHLLVLYEEKESGPGYFNVKEIVSVLEKLQKKSKVKLKDYSFGEFMLKENHVKFWKALIVCKDATHFHVKIKALTSKFNAEDASEYRVVVASSEQISASQLWFPKSKLVYTNNAADVASWWPRVLFFLFPREHKDNNVGYSLFLFDGDTVLQNVEEFAWFQRMRDVLEPLGMRCKWIGDLDNRIVTITGRRRCIQVSPETADRPDFMVILSQYGGEEMFRKTGYQIRRKIKTLVLTDDKKSPVCKEIDRALEKVYFYQTDNPLDLNLVGWAGLLREIKLVKCRDIVFTEERNVKKIVLILTILVVMFIVLPFILALIAALAFLCYCGVDVGQLVECCCCLCNCFCQCSANCVGCFLDIPFCFWCCFTIGVVNDEAFPRSDQDAHLQTVQVIQTTTVVQPQGLGAKAENPHSSSLPIVE